MGLTTSSKNKTDDAIQQRLKARQRMRTIKLLLYGTGECGKTTILRQMRLAHGQALDERAQFRGLICLNVVEGAALTVQEGKIKYKLTFDDVADEADLVVNTYKQWTKSSKMKGGNLDDPQLVMAISKLYDNAEFQAVLKHHSDYQIHDGWRYFAECLTRNPGWPEWGGPEWVPSEKDLLYSRIRTTGRNVLNFELNGTKYQLIDVGGQQAERKKFFNLFSQMDSVLFVASLSEYNQVLFEDNTTNRMTETVRVWRQTVNHPDFKTTWFLLFLNKFDLFQEKYYHEKVPIVPEFKFDKSPPNVEEEEDEQCEKAIAWFQELFTLQASRTKRRQVRLYVTTALDRKNVKRVMELCTTLLLHQGVGSV